MEIILKYLYAKTAKYFISFNLLRKIKLIDAKAGNKY